jgi:hypothetical protein
MMHGQKNIELFFWFSCLNTQDGLPNIKIVSYDVI